MLATREKAFAPLIALYQFEIEEAVTNANECEVGLGAFIMTENIARSWRVTEALEVSMVGVNLDLLSACENPFGSVKQSGYGREESRQGIEEYMVVKSMLISVPS